MTGELRGGRPRAAYPPKRARGRLAGCPQSAIRDYMEPAHMALDGDAVPCESFADLAAGSARGLGQFGWHPRLGRHVLEVEPFCSP